MFAVLKGHGRAVWGQGGSVGAGGECTLRESLLVSITSCISINI